MRGQIVVLASLLQAALAVGEVEHPDYGVVYITSTIHETIYTCPVTDCSDEPTLFSTRVAAVSTSTTADSELASSDCSDEPTVFSTRVAAVSTSATLPAGPPSSAVKVSKPPPAPLTSSSALAASTTALAISTSAAVVVPSTTVATTAAASSTAGAGQSGKIKKGVVYQGDDTLLKILNGTTEVEFLIDWSPVRPNVAVDIEFLPQIWEPPATGDVSLATFQGGTEKAASLGSKWLLAWGEQEKKDYSLMAQDFMSVIQPQAEKLGLSVAAPSVLQNPMKHNGPWLTSFMDTCDGLGCKISALTAHYWAPSGDPTWFNDFKNYVDAITAIRPNLPLFVDNLSMNGTVEEQLAFFQEVLPWAVSHDNIARIGLIPGKDSQAAFDSDGNLNAFGQYWFGA